MEIEPIDPEFVRVWHRVKGTASSSEPAPEATAGQPSPWEDFLTGKIRAERQRCRDYSALGIPAAARHSLTRARKLSTAWFLLSGERYFPMQRTASGVSVPWPLAVRQRYLEEQTSEQDYQNAAQRSQDELLQAVLNQCAQLCRETRQLLWNLLER